MATQSPIEFNTTSMLGCIDGTVLALLWRIGVQREPSPAC